MVQSARVRPASVATIYEVPITRERLPGVLQRAVLDVLDTARQVWREQNEAGTGYAAHQEAGGERRGVPDELASVGDPEDVVESGEANNVLRLAEIEELQVGCLETPSDGHRDEV